MTPATTRQEVLHRITTGPRSYVDLAGAHRGPERRCTRAIVDDLVAEGVIKLVYIDRFKYYALASWAQSDEQTAGIMRSNARKTIDGCLMWNGYVHKHNGPTTHIVKTIQIRRFLWETEKGVKLGYRDIIGVTCENPACIAMEHMVKNQRGESKRGMVRTVAQRKNLADGKRNSAHTKLNMEIAAEIRGTKGDTVNIAKKWGVSESTVRDIRTGKTWREYGNGLFTGLVAA